jgi:hypothetical protein
MLPPLILQSQGSRLWNIVDILCLKYHIIQLILNYVMCSTRMYVFWEETHLQYAPTTFAK